MPNSRDLVNEPVLTAFSLAYQPQEMIGDKVMPRVNVRSLSGRYFTTGAGDAFRARDTRKRPNGDFHESKHDIDDAATFAIDEHGLEEFVPDLEKENFAAKSEGSIDLRTSTTEALTKQVMLSRESRVATLAQDDTQYPAANKTTLTGTDRWDDASSTPDTDIENAKLITLSIPNVLAISFEVFQALKRHAVVRDQYKFTSADSITPDLLARMFDLDAVWVGKAQETTSNPGQTDAFARIWNKNAVLLKVDPNPGLKSETFAFSPEMKARRVLSARLSRGSGGEMIKVVEVVGEKITDNRQGFIFVDAVS